MKRITVPLPEPIYVWLRALSEAQRRSLTAQILTILDQAKAAQKGSK